MGEQLGWLKKDIREIRVGTSKNLEKISAVAEDVSGIKQHLSDLNGSVARHEEKLQDLDNEVGDNTLNVAKFKLKVYVTASLIAAVFNALVFLLAPYILPKVFGGG